MTSTSNEYSDDVSFAVQNIRAHISDMIFHRLSDALHAAEGNLLDLLPPDVGSEVHAHIKIPCTFNSENAGLQILQIRTFTVKDIVLGRCTAYIRWEDNKLIPEVKTEWYLDETQLRNLRVQGDLVFQA